MSRRDLDCRDAEVKKTGKSMEFLLWSKIYGPRWDLSSPNEAPRRLVEEAVTDGVAANVSQHPLRFVLESTVLNRGPRWPSSRGKYIAFLHCHGETIVDLLANPDAFAVTPRFECVNLKAAVRQFVN
jgi:hypothetical protein